MTFEFSALRERAETFARLGTRLGVAVSGGGDSLAVLHLLSDAGHSLEAVTIDHGLRPESAEEASFVSSECAALKVPHTVLHWGGPDESGNLQDQARRARYVLMARWAQDRQLNAVTLGHTLNDEAETFLMRLARGAGIDGLTRLDKRFDRNGMVFLRPFTDFRRTDLRDFLQAKAVKWVEDPSNEDERFDRVKARKILANLEPLGITVDKLAMTISNISIAQLALLNLARTEAVNSVREDSGDIVLDREAVLGLSMDTMRRILIAALQFLAGGDYPPRRATFYELWDALLDQRTLTLNGCLVSHSETTTRITREFNAVQTLSSQADALWDGRWRLVGPISADLEVRALGEAVKNTPWRETGMPRQSLLASPSVWRGDELVAAPVAGLQNGWTAEATGRGKFADFLISR